MAKQDSNDHPTTWPMFQDCPYTLEPFRLHTTLESLSAELIAEIISHFIPRERSMYRNRVKKSSKQQNPDLARSKSNPLSIMAVNSQFYHLGCQHPMLKHRRFHLKITPKGIKFENHNDRALERLRGTLVHVENLCLVFDVGYWGFNLEDGHVNKFLRHYRSLVQVLNEQEMDRYSIIRQMGLRGKVCDQGDEGLGIPDCLHEFGNDCAKALVSARSEDFRTVMGWFDPRWEVDVDAEEFRRWNMARFVVRQMAHSLRTLAKFLYRE
jgi:hypothetical protein